MKTVTWTDLVGSDYGPDMTQPVDLTHLRTPALCTMCTTMGMLLDRAVVLGGQAPTQRQQFFGRGAVTAHNVGAAMDIFYNSSIEAQRAFGNALVELFVRFRRSVGYGWLAYNRTVFGQTRMEDTDGDPHTDHIHIDWVNGPLTTRSTALSSFTFIDGMGLQTKNVPARGQDMSMTTNSSADSAAPADFAAAFAALCSGWSAASIAKYKDFKRGDYDDAYAGLASGVDLSWLLGWWQVWDGNSYYYYFDHAGKVVWVDNRPTSPTAPAPVAPGNKGNYSFDGSGQLILQWTPVKALPATVETFYNAKTGATQMNANSNQYSPLVATRVV